MRFLTAGESHGPGLVVIAEGLPRGVPVSAEMLDHELRRRRAGYGRGPRAKSEPEEIEILAGLRGGRTTGAPVSVLLRHRHWPTWRPVLDPWIPMAEGRELEGAGPDLAGVRTAPTRPRPGHADLAGAYKYGLRDLRDVIERASARETAARTVAGTLAKAFLLPLGVAIKSHVSRIGPCLAGLLPRTLEEFSRADASPVRTLDPESTAAMMSAIDTAAANGDTLGGTFDVAAFGIPAGLGGYGQWDQRLDGKLAQAVMSIPGVKGVEIGEGFALAALRGSEAHDAILPDPPRGTRRPANRAGGIEGGLSNGETILVRAAVKPVPTLAKPLPSVDLATGLAAEAAVERSDVCVVPAAAVVGEAMVAWVLAGAFLDKFGGDTLDEVARAFASYGDRQPWHA